MTDDTTRLIINLNCSTILTKKLNSAKNKIKKRKREEIEKGEGDCY